jgi:hypothetical protein
MKVQRNNRGIALLFLWPRRWKGWAVNATPRRLYPWRACRYPSYGRTGSTAVPVWTVARSLCSGRHSIPRPAMPHSSRCTDYAISPFEGFLSFKPNRTSSIVAVTWTAHVGSQAEGRRCARSSFTPLLDPTTQKGYRG